MGDGDLCAAMLWAVLFIGIEEEGKRAAPCVLMTGVVTSHVYMRLHRVGDTAAE